MKVAVTGGTGFVGSHAVQALVDAGHEVRLLIRDIERVPVAFEPHGVDELDDLLVGDVTSPVDVETFLQGCDAVVHAASIYSLDIRDAAEIRSTNVTGTKLIIEAARRLGLDPIVHISSTAALIPADRPVGPDSPVTEHPAGVYGRSKAESEALARSHQEQGAPVVTMMPGTIWGPHDPHFGESDRIATDFLRGQSRMFPSGGAVGIVDVRDLAAAVVASIEPNMGPRRFTLAPNHLAVVDLFAALNRITGRNVRFFALPDGLVRAGVAPASLLQRIVPPRLPFNTESVNAALGWAPVNSNRAAEEFGIEWRPLEETLADTVRSLLESGRIEAKHAGRLAAPVA